MRILIAEDDMASRLYLQKFLEKYGECQVVVDGMEVVDAYLTAVKDHRPYDLICLDIMMPNLDGIKALKAIRDMEAHKGVAEADRVKVIMITALDDKETVMRAYDTGCEAYARKPIEKEKFIQAMERLGLIVAKGESSW